METNDVTQLERKTDVSETTTDLTRNAASEISSALRPLLADVFALYIKTKNFHWHMSGREPPPILRTRELKVEWRGG